MADFNIMVLINMEIQKEKCAIIFEYLNEEKEEKVEQGEQIIEFRKEESVIVVCNFNAHNGNERDAIII